MSRHAHPLTAEDLIDRALAEDVGPGDWTTQWTVPPHTRARGRIVAKAEGVIAGVDIAVAVFHRLDPSLSISVEKPDGEAVRPGDIVIRIEGTAHGILTGERTALNFLQRLSGVATLTRQFVDAVAGTGARILDTRKTTPGWRELEKAAVRAGGGSNHRFGLHDMVLIKENHATAAGGLAAAIARVRERNEARLEVEVEAHSLDDVAIALDGGVDRILLDNMDVQTLTTAVRQVREHAQRTGVAAPRLEASGNMTLQRVAEVARTGVDDISIGALTHSAPALDLSLLLDIG